MSLNLNDIVTDGSAKFQVVKSATDLDVSKEIARLKNELGYRKPNTSYNVGDIVYHKSLSIGQYLECTTAGTSKNNELVINTATIGTTINDGTIIWTINRDLSVSGGTINGNLNVTGIIDGTSSSADFLEFRNKTIPQIKELIRNYILSLNVPGKDTYSKSFFNSIFNIQTFISLWNKEDTTSLVSDGLRWVFSNYIYSPNYFKLKLDSYGSDNYNRDCYEIIYTNGIWSKIRRIIIADSDDNNKELVNIEGDLTVKDIYSYGSLIIEKIRRNVDHSELNLIGGSDINKGAIMVLSGMSHVNNGQFIITARNSSDHASLYGKPNGELIWENNDLAGAAIQAKSFGTNGYIKYACGLIIQKIYIPIENTNLTGVSAFPISFSSSIYAAAYCCFDTTAASNDTCSIIGISNTQISWKRSTNYYGINIIAIGY